MLTYWRLLQLVYLWFDCVVLLCCVVFVVVVNFTFSPVFGVFCDLCASDLIVTFQFWLFVHLFFAIYLPFLFLLSSCFLVFHTKTTIVTSSGRCSVKSNITHLRQLMLLGQITNRILFLIFNLLSLQKGKKYLPINYKIFFSTLK